MHISHIIFTRFNLQYEPNEIIGIQPKWLEDRLSLFEQYCLPSIQKQTCQDFVWIFLGDIRTPEEYKTRINNYHSIFPQIRTYWIVYQNDAYHSFYKQLGQEFAKETDVFISTRLDNDDALACDYIERVQDIAKKGGTGIVSFPIGRQTFTRDNKSYKILYKQNHFTSRIETSKYETIMVFDHTQIPMSSLQIIETEEPMWEEIVHGNNIANSFQPHYHYFTKSISDLLDLSHRWIIFQKNHLIQFTKTLFRNY